MNINQLVRLLITLGQPAGCGCFLFKLCISLFRRCHNVASFISETHTPRNVTLTGERVRWPFQINPVPEHLTSSVTKFNFEMVCSDSYITLRPHSFTHRLSAVRPSFSHFLIG